MFRIFTENTVDPLAGLFFFSGQHIDKCHLQTRIEVIGEQIRRPNQFVKGILGLTPITAG